MDSSGKCTDIKGDWPATHEISQFITQQAIIQEETTPIKIVITGCPSADPEQKVNKLITQGLTSRLQAKDKHIKFDVIYVRADKDQIEQHEFLKTISGAELVFVCYDTADKTTFDRIESTVMSWMISDKSTVPVVLLGTNTQVMFKRMLDSNKSNLVQKTQKVILK